jgi:succinoglycan biosynthesis transport protein ExoP
MEPHPQEFIKSDEIDLRQYLFLLRSHLWLLILAAVLAGAVAFGVSNLITPVYRASTTLLIDEAPSVNPSDYNSLLASERRARTYAQLLTEEPVLETTIQRLGLGMDVETLKKRVKAEWVSNTQLIELQAEDTNPQQAARIANTIAEVFSEQTQALQTSRYAASKESLVAQLADLDEQIQQASTALGALGDGPEDKAERDRLEALLAQYRQTYTGLLESYEQLRAAEAQTTSNVIQVEPATPPRKPARPKVLLNVAVAALLGMILGAAMAFAREALDDTVKDPEEITRHLGLPVLGLIAHAEVTEGELIAATQPLSLASEAFRSLRTNIRYTSVDGTLQTILVTSPSSEDGKTTVAANLGVVLAQNDNRVVVMEGDLRRPSLHKILDLPNRIGMSDLFIEPQDYLDGALQKTEVPGLLALTSGDLPLNPSELLDSERARQILSQVMERSDVVLIDAPPVIAIADAVSLAPHVAGVLLVLRAGKTSLAASKQATEQLRRVGANLIGAVLTDVDTSHSRYYGYYRYTHYGHDGMSSRPGKRLVARKGRRGKGSRQRDISEPEA